MEKRILGRFRHFKLSYIILFWIALGFVVFPMINTILKSFETGGMVFYKNYTDYFANPNNLRVVYNTFKMGIVTVIVCGFIGTILALYTGFVEMRFRKAIHVLLLSPMMVPGVVIVIAFIQLYGESGMVTKLIQAFFGLESIPYRFGEFWGIIFVHAYTQYVYFYLNVSISLKYLDYAAIEAARGLGASKFHIFRTVVWPFILPALLSSSIVTFISGIASFSAPNLIGGRYKVLSTQIMISKSNNYLNLASMQVVILMGMGLVVMFLMRYFEQKYSQEASVRSVAIERVRLKNRVLSFGLSFLILALVVMIVLPVFTIFVFSFADSSSIMMDIFPKEFGTWNYAKIIEKKRVMKPFLNSIVMPLQAVGVGLLISLPVAYMSAKRKNRVNVLLELLFMIPWAMPASTIAINLINSFNKKNIFVFNEILIGTYWIVPLAYILTALPLLIRTNMLAFGSFNMDLEYASRGLGSGRVRSFLTVTAPVISPAIFSGAILVFIKCVGEYTMSALLYGISNRPVSIAMVTAMQEFDLGLCMAYGSLVVLICIAAMVVVFRFDKTKRV